MSQATDDIDDDGGESDAGDRTRQKKRVNVEIQLADAQKALARASEKNARYLLWSVVLATISAVVSMAGVLYVLSVN